MKDEAMLALAKELAKNWTVPGLSET